ncbi:anaerobic ribonucleoside-triphosphate reductase 1 [Klebsiella phage vB_Kpn_3]|nr:anaerobic ribonucleoside-triphosphate reductase 1 [Klebsiella phage vB_Kpn_3]
MDTALKALEWRVDRLKYIQAKAAPILYMSGAFGLRLEADEYVWSIFYSRASVSLGYIGCHEMLQFMFGKDVDTMSRPAIKFAERVLQYMKDRWIRRRKRLS